MSFLTTSPSRFIVGLPPITDVVTSATGDSSTNSAQLNNLLTLFNTANASASLNILSAYNGGAITVKNNLNLSNAVLMANSNTLLTSNALNGLQYMAVQINNVESARYVASGLGLGVTAPVARLDVNGNEVVRGTLYISTMGQPVTPALGNLYADGDLYANGVHYPSDPGLKRDFKPYKMDVLPDAYEFIWRSTGLRDIGVNAAELMKIEPACVQRGPGGLLAVDYPKLTVLCLAELRSLKTQVVALQSTVSGLAV